MRIHDNDLDLCQYCPYRYEKPSNYTTHLKKHFGIEDFACDHCDKKFPTVTQLNLHHEQHEGIIYYCLICIEYEGQGSTHRLVRGPNLTLVRASLIKPSYEVPWSVTWTESILKFWKGKLLGKIYENLLKRNKFPFVGPFSRHQRQIGGYSDYDWLD